MFNEEVYLTPINFHPLRYLDLAPFVTGEDLRRLTVKICKAENVRDFATCLKLCDEAITVLPDTIEFRIKKVRFLVFSHQFEEAHEILDGIIKRFPRNAEALSALGLSFYHQGNFEKSVEVCNTVLQINPMMVETKVLRAKALKLKELVKTGK